MDELLRETFSFDAPDFECSVSEIELSIKRNEQVNGSFTVSSEDAFGLRGFVLSDNRRITILKEEIQSSPFTVEYCVDTIGMDPGDEIRGSIIVETSSGETVIPLYVKITDEIPADANEEVKALEDFARLAQSNPGKAFRFFVSEEFPSVLNGKNTIYRALYRGLSQNPVTYQHMEEFLIATGKKEPVRISTDRHEKSVYRVSASQRDTIYIYKSTWGYCHIDISITGDFIETGRLEVTNDDFIGRVFGLEFVINKEKLSMMPKIGRIILKTPYEEIVVEIEAAVEGGMKLISGVYRKKRFFELVRSFLDLQLKKMDYHTWYVNSMRLIGEMKEEKEDGITLFAEAYLAYCNDDNKRAMELLWKAKSQEYVIHENWERAAYLYLAKVCGLIPPEKADIAPRLYTYYQQQPDCYLLLALYMKEDEAAPYRAVWGLQEYERAYELGCSSPFLFLKAWKELEKQESRLRSLSPFILRVLLFASKEGLLTENLLLRAAHISENERTFKPALYRLLKEGYALYPSKDLLEAICRYIVKDDPSKTAYYEWYEKAVNSDIRLTRLFENYMYTRPEEDETDFPKPVKLYFSTNHTLGERKKAYLYSIIVRYKEQDPVSYDNYRQEMETFAIDSLTAGKISNHLSVLYSEFIIPRKDLEMASALARVVFTNRLVCKDPDIRNVVVCHPSLKDESSFEVTDGVAYPNIYGPDACILLEDRQKRRFAATIPYRIEPLMDVKKAARACVDLGVWDTGLQLYCCHERGWQMDVNTRTVLSFLKAAENPEFTRKYRDRLRYKLLVYFSRHTNDPYANKFAGRIKEGTYGWVDKNRTFELLTEFELNEKSMSLVDKLGYEKLDRNRLLNLADARIYELSYEADPALLSLCDYLFRCGKHTEKTFCYLSRYYEGSLADMDRLWCVSKRGDQDAKTLEERILLTSMFTRKLTDHTESILCDYAKGEANESLMKAFLTFIGQYSILENKELAASTADLLRGFCDLKDDHVNICRLAWLKYQSEKTDLTQYDHVEVLDLLKKCSARDLRFSFMQTLAKRTADEISISDKTIVEERFPSGSQVLIHYRTGEGAYRTEPMKEKIKGLFTREFLLFYKEKLEYYCTVKRKDTVYDTQNVTLEPTRECADGHSRYHILNRILMASEEGKEDEAKQAAAQYLRQEACADLFFGVL